MKTNEFNQNFLKFTVQTSAQIEYSTFEFYPDRIYHCIR